jgi:quinol monooxygenase YgiN
MITVIASIRVNQAHLPSFLEIFKSNLIDVRNESGCIEYYPALDVDAGLTPQALDPNVVTVIEKWSSLEDLRSHLTAPHMQAYRQKVQGMVDSVTLKVLKEA